MAKHHHDYSLDKDTPESIRQLTDQGPKWAHTGQHGLPAGDILDHFQEPDGLSEDESLAADTIAAHGKGADRPLPNQFHSRNKMR